MFQIGVGFVFSLPWQRLQWCNHFSLYNRTWSHQEAFGIDSKFEGISIISNDGKRKTTTKFNDTVITYLELPPIYRRFSGRNEVELSNADKDDLLRGDYLLKLKSPSTTLKMKDIHLLYCGIDEKNQNRETIIVYSADQPPTKLIFDRASKMLVGMEYKKLPDLGDNVRVQEEFKAYKKIAGVYLPTMRTTRFTNGLTYRFNIKEAFVHKESDSEHVFSKP